MLYRVISSKTTPQENWKIADVRALVTLLLVVVEDISLNTTLVLFSFEIIIIKVNHNPPLRKFHANRAGSWGGATSNSRDWVQNTGTI
jgi:hypothetical protein